MAERLGIEIEEGVDEVLAKYRKFISDRPRLVSLLYDIDMLPEQTVTFAGAMRLAGLCEVYKAGENGELLPEAAIKTQEIST